MAIKISGVNIVDDSQNLRITGLSTFTNGPVLIGAATSTGTASQPLQVTGGGYVSGDLGIGTINPTSKLHISGGDVTLGVGVTITGATNDSLIINSTRSITNGTSIVSNILPTTVSYGSSFVVASQETDARDVVFSNDGKTMYVVGNIGNDITYYTLSTPWSVTSASYVSEFSVSSQLTNPFGMYFKPDGTKFYVVGSTGVGAAATSVNQYTCSTPWDLTTASYDSVAFSVISQETGPRGVEFKPDGTKFYVTGTSTNDGIYQYSCSTPWNVSTASYDNVSFSVTAQEANPEKVRFSSDGTKFLVIGITGDDINYYTLTTPWNVSTASFVGIITSLSSVIGETTPQGLYWKPDGTKLYACGITNDAVYEFNMTSNADLEVIGETKLYGDVEVHQDLKVYGGQIHSTGRVSIGSTTDSGDRLYVAGTLKTTNNIIIDNAAAQVVTSSASGYLSMTGSTENSAGANIILYGESHGTLPNVHRFRQAGTTYLQIANGGNISINSTSDVGETFYVNGNIRGTVIKAASGDSDAAPGHTWNTDEDTGMFRVGANNFGMSAAGNEVCRFNRNSGNGDGSQVYFNSTGTIDTSANALYLLSATNVRSATVYNATTAAAANMTIDGSENFRRSTSSIKYKTEIETADTNLSENLVYNSEPVWYRSLCDGDPEDWSYWGFIAEEVAEIDPRMVHWGDDGPEGVQYDRYVVHLVNVIQKQKQQLDNLESRLAALEAAQS